LYDTADAEGLDVGLIEAPPLGTTLKGGYQLLRFLGAGGMGAVYEALAPDGSRVAVKTLLNLPDSRAGHQMLARFEREASVTATLDNPHVVALLDSGFDDELGMPFIVMPLMSGLDLEQLIEKIGPLHPTVAVRIIRQACVALSAAHLAGVIHRDIKPANIYLDHEPNGEVTVRVLDFGIAKWRAADSSLTRTGAAMGTPIYMSPEQTLDAKDVDARADVWSLAITLYEALAGVSPFDELETFAEVHVAINVKDVRHLQEFAPWLDPGLASVVHGGLIRERDDRCPDIVELSAGLAPFAYGSNKLDAGMLTPVSKEILEAEVGRASLPDRWTRMPPSNPEPDLAQTQPDNLLGLTLGDKYTLLWRLGQGGMGAVYEALGDDGNRYAVKIIEPELAGKKPGARRRFVREARAAASLSSDHVVQMVQADTDPRQQLPYIVMELLQGADLDARIQRGGPLHPMTAARIFVQACSGIQAAHDIGLVHRDIKPANLFLHQTPSGQIVVKVCDFGIAKQLKTDGEESATNLTRTGGMIGSPIFMSPEQAKNAKDVDARTDIWSLGISLFQALCGSSPWAGHTSVGEVLLAIYTEQLPHIQDTAPWVPPGLVEVVHKALARNLDRRFQSMREFAEALAPFTGGDLAVNDELLKPVQAADRDVRAHARAARS